MSQKMSKKKTIRYVMVLLSIGLAATAAYGAEHESHMVKLAEAKIEYFSEGQGDIVVLLPGEFELVE